jgi:hypothetical protein
MCSTSLQSSVNCEKHWRSALWWDLKMHEPLLIRRNLQFVFRYQRSNFPQCGLKCDEVPKNFQSFMYRALRGTVLLSARFARSKFLIEVILGLEFSDHCWIRPDPAGIDHRAQCLAVVASSKRADGCRGRHHDQDALTRGDWFGRDSVVASEQASVATENRIRTQVPLPLALSTSTSALCRCATQ